MKKDAEIGQNNVEKAMKVDYCREIGQNNVEKAM